MCLKIKTTFFFKVTLVFGTDPDRNRVQTSTTRKIKKCIWQKNAALDLTTSSYGLYQLGYFGLLLGVILTQSNFAEVGGKLSFHTPELCKFS
jgi:hypothetical protein